MKSCPFPLYIPLFVIFIFGTVISAVCEDIDSIKEVWGEFRDIPHNRSERCDEVVEIFMRFGATEIYIEPVGLEGLEGEGMVDCPGNVIVPLKVKGLFGLTRIDRGSIIISAHLDKDGAGSGALDDYSGILMMAALYEELSRMPLRHNFLFVAFDREEEGLLGSKAFVSLSPHMPEALIAVINLECLGITLPHPWPEGSSDTLEELFRDVGEDFGYDLSPVSLKHVTTDSVPFLKAGFPAITVDGIMPEDLVILGSIRDQSEIIDRELFFESYQIILDFIMEVDALDNPPDPTNKK